MELFELLGKTLDLELALGEDVSEGLGVGQHVEDVELAHELEIAEGGVLSRKPVQ